MQRIKICKYISLKAIYPVEFPEQFLVKDERHLSKVRDTDSSVYQLVFRAKLFTYVPFAFRGSRIE